MFEFAISQYQRRKPARRLYASWVASCVFHLALLILLIRFPQLLQGGMYHGFHPVSLLQGIMPPDNADEDQNWRTVAVLKNSPPMKMPSPATLRQYLSDRDRSESGGDVQTVRVRWRNDPGSSNESELQVPRVVEEPAARGPEAAGDSSGSQGEGTVADHLAASSSGSGTSTSDYPASGRNEESILPPPIPEPKSEIARNKVPETVPKEIPPPPKISHAEEAPDRENGPDAVRIFENEQKAIRSEGSGLFDTQGFPLGDYASQIVGRVKEKWYIPSNLRNAHGHTTVVFFIDKKGRFTDARIVTSSGHKSLNLAALNAVIESNPFPPLPEGFPGEHVGVKFIFSYNEPQ